MAMDARTPTASTARIPLSPLDDLPVGVLVHHGTITYVNHRVAEILGLSREALVGRSFRDVVAPDELEKLTLRYQTRLQGEPVPAEYETAVVRPDGSRRVVALTVAAQGEVATVLVRDVTDQAARRTQRFALAHLATAIAAEHTEDGVHRVVREGLAREGLATLLLVPDDTSLRVSWSWLPPGLAENFESQTGRTVVGMTGPVTPAMVRALRDGESYTDDAATELACFVGAQDGRRARAMALAAGLTRAVVARVQVQGEPPGILCLLGDWVREDDLAAAHLLGRQVSAALENARVLAGTRRRLRDLESLHDLARRVLAATPEEPSALVAAACEALAGALDARWAAAWLLDDQGHQLVCQGTWSAGTRVSVPTVLSVTDRAMVRAVMAAGVAVTVSDTRTDPRSGVAEVPAVAHGAAVVLPIVARRGPIGLVTVTCSPGRAFADDEVAVTVAMGTLLALGLENAELLAEVRRRLQEISLVHEVGRTVAGSLDLQRVLNDGCEALRQLLDASHVFAMLYEPGARELRGAGGSDGVGEDFLAVRIPMDGPGLSAAALNARQTFLVEDAENDPRVMSSLRERYGEKSLLVVPLFRRDEPVGVVVVDECRRQRRFTDTEIERTVLVANQLAVAIDNARLHAETRRSYAALAAAQAMLVHRERLAALGEMAAAVAHEVRNPLGVIFNSLGALGRTLKAAPGTHTAMLLGILQEEAQRLNRIVGDLLDFARPLRTTVRPESVTRVLEDALTAVMAMEAAAGVTLVQALPAELPDVAMDARLVRQAVINVAQNALQAMPHGGTLTVRARSDGPYAAIELEDTGPGMTMEVAARIFEPFFTTRAMGTGLGLAVVHRIVQGHGGEVSMSTVLGQGTRFTLRLPWDGPPAPPEGTTVTSR